MSGRALPLAVDLGTARVRVVAAERRRDGALHLTGVGGAELAGGAEPGEALRRALREAGGAQRHCTMMLGAAEAPLRWIAFPAMPVRERRRACAFEGRAALGSPHDRAIVREAPVKDGRTLVGAATSASIERLRRAAEIAGMRVRAIAHQALVLAAAEDVPILDVGATHATLALTCDGVPLVRVLPFGGARLTDALSRAYGIKPELAEHRKRTIGLGGAAGEECEDLVASLEASLRELWRAEGVEIGEVRLTGNGARLIGFGETLSSRLGISLAPARVGRLLETGLPPAAERAASFDWFAAAALAAAGAQA